MTRSYSDCFFCGGAVKERLIQRDVWWEGRLFVVDKVPVGVCNQCGEKVVLPEVAKQVDAILHQPGSPDRVITVPVYSLS
jgi:YgiT-type zinc finger domain-containing protein